MSSIELFHIIAFAAAGLIGWLLSHIWSGLERRVGHLENQWATVSMQLAAINQKVSDLLEIQGRRVGDKPHG